MTESTIQAKMTVAMVAQETHRYDDMVEIMTKTVEMCRGKINKEQREQLVVAFKMAVQQRQSNVDWIHKFMSRTKFDNSESVREVDQYRTKIESEITALCKDLVTLIEQQILPNINTKEERVYYLSVQGDFRSHALAINSSDVTMVNKIKQDYEHAYEQSRLTLKVTDKLRLYTAFNMAMFYYRNLSYPEKALEIAKLALDEFEQANVSSPDTMDIVNTLNETVKLLTPDKDRWPIMVFH